MTDFGPTSQRRGSERQRFPEGWDWKENGYLGAKEMEDGRMWLLMPLWGNRVRIVIGEDEFTAGEHWCFSDPQVGAMQWLLGCLASDPAPEGWTRHMFPDGKFERRDEDGNPYVSEAD